MKKRLLIIGNGFDLYLGLNTRFSDFADVLKSINLDEYNKIKKYWNLSNNMEWNQIEERIFQKYIELLDSVDFSDEINFGGQIPRFNTELLSFKKHFFEYLEKYVVNDKEQNRNVKDKYEELVVFLKQFDNIFSYNYTGIIENNLIEIKINHLHGKINFSHQGSIEKYEEINLGYDITFENPDNVKYGSDREYVLMYCNKYHQTLYRDNYIKWDPYYALKNLTGIEEFEEIVIFGLSLGNSDQISRNKIINAECRLIIIDFWNSEEKRKFKEKEYKEKLPGKEFILLNSKELDLKTCNFG